MFIQLKTILCLLWLFQVIAYKSFFILFIRSHGIILEGFPRTPEESKYLAESGLYPDGMLFLTVAEDDICNRLMPPIYERWKKQRDKTKAEKEKVRNEKLKQRVIIFMLVVYALCCIF